VLAGLSYEAVVPFSLKEEQHMRRRHELTDEQWERIEPRLPGREGTRGVTAKDNRLFMNAVLYVAKTGIPWRDLPERFGNWNSVWRRFDRWCAAGVWQQLTDVLGEADLEELLLDSTTIKAHPSASGSRKQPSEKKRRRTRGDASAAPAAD
jgi:putative transposase